MLAWFGRKIALTKRLHLIRSAGFSSTAFWYSRKFSPFREGHNLEIPQLIRQNGLGISYIHADYFRCNQLWSEEPEKQAQALADYTDALEFCGKSRVKGCVIHVTKGLNPPEPNPNGLTAMSKLLDKAENLGVDIYVENTRDTAHLDYLFENIDHPRLGFCYDSSHDLLHSTEPGAVLERWNHRLMMTHLSGNDGKTDTHILPDNYETLQWAKILRAFPASISEDKVSMEVILPDDDVRSPGVFIEKTYTMADELFRRLKRRI